jgi:pilus assembly protein CpaC
MKTLLFSMLLFCLNASASNQIHHLLLGEELRLPLSSNRVWIEESKVVKGEVAGSQLKVIGLKEGSSVVGIGDKKYQIYVVHPKKYVTLKELENILTKVLGLKVSFDHGETVVEGELFRLEDWKKIANKLSGIEADYRMSAKISEGLLPEIKKYFDSLMEQNRLPPQEIIFSNLIELRLPLKHTYLEAYKKLLAPYGIKVNEDTKSLALEPTVRVQVTVAEVQREFTQSIGLQWPTSFQAQLLPEAMWNFSSVEAVAQFFESNGKGRVLASPNLICRSGKEAEFLAGGEFPIKVTNYKMQNVLWKKYGILLHVKPVADALGQISLQIDTEISTLDNSKAVDGVPGLITHKVSSYFDLRKPQTIALSGLIKNEEGSTTSGLPWLSRIPVFGKLFASEDFRESRSELVIFVRPEVIDLQSSPDSKPIHLKEVSL